MKEECDSVPWKRKKALVFLGLPAASGALPSRSLLSAEQDTLLPSLPRCPLTFQTFATKKEKKEMEPPT